MKAQVNKPRVRREPWKSSQRETVNKGRADVAGSEEAVLGQLKEEEGERKRKKPGGMASGKSPTRKAYISSTAIPKEGVKIP